ncbi:LMBR1 domain-containing protein [Rhizoctonia solani AG-1 IA]|uniref:LMBR1 domain-containing protein n=1 Tax=Thanatephorus cucumeris (strain AG1-IA) TaxID=983506 RepID=L8WQ83_THACA|nr:LMBR1 domain-containing protein [Rhizoctonia solani AG-1 IA]
MCMYVASRTRFSWERGVRFKRVALILLSLGVVTVLIIIVYFLPFLLVYSFITSFFRFCTWFRYKNMDKSSMACR